MLKVEIYPLSRGNKLQALSIVLESKVGPRIRTLRFFNKSLTDKTNNVFLAFLENKVIGLIGWYKDDGKWAGKSLGDLFPYGDKVYWVSYFAVKEKFRNKDIGTKLMTKLLDELRNKKAKELWVYTSRAKRFYQKVGFEFQIRAAIEKGPHDFLKLKFK